MNLPIIIAETAVNSGDALLTVGNALGFLGSALCAYIIWTLKSATSRWDAKADAESVAKDIAALTGLITKNAEQDAELRKTVEKLSTTVAVYIESHNRAEVDIGALQKEKDDTYDSIEVVKRRLENHDVRLNYLEKKAG